MQHDVACTFIFVTVSLCTLDHSKSQIARIKRRNDALEDLYQLQRQEKRDGGSPSVQSSKEVINLAHVGVLNTGHEKILCKSGFKRVPSYYDAR